jgi:taurine dioxygenase
LSSMNIEPMSAALGAEVMGFDLRELDESRADQLRELILEYQVVGFRDQHLSDDEHVAVAEALGDPWIHPMDRLVGVTSATPSELRVKSDHQLKTDTWHIDVTYAPCPPAFGILRAIDVPPVGGDTMWANLTLAAERLPEELRAQLQEKVTVHDVPEILIELKAPAFPDQDTSIWQRELVGVRQPLLRRHPETDAVGIFGLGDAPVEGLTDSDSADLMALVTEHATNLNFTCRWRWRNGDVVIWDERCTAHYAVRDPWKGERVLRRLLVEGDQPIPAP